MKYTNEGSINLKAIRFEVDDLEANIEFYKKLGCIVEKVDDTSVSVSVYIRFNKDTNVLIHLLKDFRRKEELTDKEKEPVFEVCATENEGQTFPDVFEEIAQNGIQYKNVNPEKHISMIAKFDDENGHSWELIDDFDYLAIDEPK